MATLRYKSSKATVKILAIMLAVALLTLILLSINSNTTALGVLKMIVIFVLFFGLLLYAIYRCYIEIDTDTGTMVYCKWPIKSVYVPIDNIIRIGYPEQWNISRSLNSFVYVLYEDIRHSRERRHIKIKDIQFSPQTFKEIADKLKMINPNIEFDNKFIKMTVTNKYPS